MKRTHFTVWKRALLSLGFASLIFSACKKSNDNNIAQGVSVTLGGKSWTATEVEGYGSNSWVDLQAYSASDQTAVDITVYSELKIGKADDFSNSYLWIGKSTGQKYESSADGSHGTLTLNSWDSTSATKRVTGTFSGTFYNPDDAKDSLAVTNGKFNYTYTEAP